MFEKLRDGRTDLVFESLAAGHAATKADEYCVPLIKWCAYQGDVAAMRVLLENGESLQSLGEILDVHGAAFYGHWQPCQFLIENGADVNFQLKDTGEAPLHTALCKANRPVYEHVVTLLLAAGADPNVKTEPDVATDAFMRDSRIRSDTPLHRAAAFGTERSIKMLLDAGADPEVRDMHGDTPLSWASWHLRPPSILRLHCYGGLSIHLDNRSSYDRGRGWGQIDQPLMSRPHV